MDSLLFKIKAVIKMLITYVFYFPGLVLHEGSHALAALVTMSKITSIKLLPSISFSPSSNAYTVTYGYVNSIGSYRVAYVLIGLAPIGLWLIPTYIAQQNGWFDYHTLSIHWSQFLRLQNWWFILLIIQITWAGTPSSQDWKVFFHGLFSVSFAVLSTFAYLIYTYFYPYYLKGQI